MQAEVEAVADGYRVLQTGGRLQWETVGSREEMGLHFLDRNKLHLQQVSKENGIPMQELSQQLIGEDSYSDEGGRILVGNIEWSEIPDNEEVRA